MFFNIINWKRAKWSITKSDTEKENQQKERKKNISSRQETFFSFLWRAKGTSDPPPSYLPIVVTTLLIVAAIFSALVLAGGPVQLPDIDVSFSLNQSHWYSSAEKDLRTHPIIPIILVSSLQEHRCNGLSTTLFLQEFLRFSILL